MRGAGDHRHRRAEAAARDHQVHALAAAHAVPSGTCRWPSRPGRRSRHPPRRAPPGVHDELLTGGLVAQRPRRSRTGPRPGACVVLGGRCGRCRWPHAGAGARRPGRQLAADRVGRGSRWRVGDPQQVDHPHPGGHRSARGRWPCGPGPRCAARRRSARRGSAPRPPWRRPAGPGPGRGPQPATGCAAGASCRRRHRSARACRRASRRPPCRSARRRHWPAAGTGTGRTRCGARRSSSRPRSVRASCTRANSTLLEVAQAAVRQARGPARGPDRRGPRPPPGPPTARGRPRRAPPRTRPRRRRRPAGPAGCSGGGSAQGGQRGLALGRAEVRRGIVGVMRVTGCS